MTEPTAANETPFWRFSLHFYRQAGVAEACITLQDECGVDVNLLLFLLWLAAGRRQLSAVNIKDLDAAVRDWRRLTIVPIRDVRRKLKGAATLVEANKQEAFRTKIKAIELESERLQQEAMAALAAGLKSDAAASAEAAARASIASYQSVIGRPFTASAVDTLIAALK